MIEEGADTAKGFADWNEAEDYFCEKSGAEKFVLGSGKPFNS